MAEYELGSGILLREFEVSNRVDSRFPASRPPGLDDSLVRRKFDVPSGNVAAEESERTSRIRADLRGLVSQRHSLHGGAELHDFIELFGIGQGLVDALPAGFEKMLLMNRFGRMRHLILCCCQSFS